MFFVLRNLAISHLNMDHNGITIPRPEINIPEDYFKPQTGSQTLKRDPLGVNLIKSKDVSTLTFAQMLDNGVIDQEGHSPKKTEENLVRKILETPQPTAKENFKVVVDASKVAGVTKSKKRSADQGIEETPIKKSRNLSGVKTDLDIDAITSLKVAKIELRRCRRDRDKEIRKRTNIEQGLDENVWKELACILYGNMDFLVDCNEQVKNFIGQRHKISEYLNKTTTNTSTRGLHLACNHRITWKMLNNWLSGEDEIVERCHWKDDYEFEVTLKDGVRKVYQKKKNSAEEKKDSAEEKMISAEEKKNPVEETNDMVA